MKITQVLVVLFASSLFVSGQSNQLSVLFVKASESPKMPIISPEKRIAEATIRQLDRSAFEKRVTRNGLPRLSQKPEPVSGIRKIVNGIDLTNSNGGDEEMISIETVSFGHGNAKTIYDRVDILKTDLSPKISIGHPTLIFQSPGDRDNVSFLLTVNFKF